MTILNIIFESLGEEKSKEEGKEKLEILVDQNNQGSQKKKKQSYGFETSSRFQNDAS